jgi:hypothetical protein
LLINILFENRYVCCIANENMLLCKKINCHWHLVYIKSVQRYQTKGIAMPTKLASLDLVPSPSLLSRLLAVLDRVLMANADIALRNGDLPYFGL